MVVSKFKLTTVVVVSLLILVGSFVAAVPSHASINVPLYIELSGHGMYVSNPLPVYENYYFWGDTVEITITGDDVSNSSSTRYFYDGVIGTGSGSYTGAAAVFHVTMNEEIFEDVQWRDEQKVIFDASGITGATGSSTVVTIEGSAKIKIDLPFTAWYSYGTVVTFTYSPIVAGAYDLSSTIVTMTDASGHSYSTGVTNTHTVTGPATITSTYIPHPSTPSVPSVGSTTPPAPPPSGGLDILSIFGGLSETLRGFWGTISSWGSGAGGSGGLSIGTFGAWFSGSTYEIPHIGIVLLAILGFVILLVWRRRRKD